MSALDQTKRLPDTDSLEMSQTKRPLDSRRIKLVDLKEPCSACLIIDGLLRETLDKLQRDYPQLEIEYVQLENLKTIHEVEGLEIEKFPAIIIDNEQITAGSLLTKQQFMQILQNGGYI